MVQTRDGNKPTPSIKALNESLERWWQAVERKRRARKYRLPYRDDDSNQNTIATPT